MAASPTSPAAKQELPAEAVAEMSDDAIQTIDVSPTIVPSDDEDEPEVSTPTPAGAAASVPTVCPGEEATVSPPARRSTSRQSQSHKPKKSRSRKRRDRSRRRKGSDKSRSRKRSKKSRSRKGRDKSRHGRRRSHSNESEASAGSPNIVPEVPLTPPSSTMTPLPISPTSMPVPRVVPMEGCCACDDDSDDEALAHLDPATRANIRRLRRYRKLKNRRESKRKAKRRKERKETQDKTDPFLQVKDEHPDKGGGGNGSSCMAPEVKPQLV